MHDQQQDFALLAKQMMVPDQRSSLFLEDINTAKCFVANIKDTKTLVENLTDISSALRFLRNACIECKRNQDLIVDSKIVKSIKNFITIAFDPNLTVIASTESERKSVNQLKMLLIQFLGNLVVQNEAAVQCVWQNLFPKSFFVMMSNLDSRGKDFVCMLLYNCLRNGFTLTEEGEEFWLMVSVIDHCNDFQDVEWGLFVMELVLSSPQNFRMLYTKLIDYPAQRTSLIDILLGYLTDKIPDGLTIPEENLTHLSREFETKSSCMMMLAKNTADEDVQAECQNLYKLLCVLSAATGHAEMYPNLRRSEALLKTTIKLLAEVCKCSEPVVAGMTSSDATKDNNQPEKHEKEHPMYDVKRTLVKMIGNMCYQNRQMQDATRQHGGITPLLNCCVVDDRNPFLMQWAIFAVRAICEGNIENQNFIAGLENQGIVENILNDTKIATRLENGKIKLCSIDE